MAEQLINTLLQLHSTIERRKTREKETKRLDAVSKALGANRADRLKFDQMKFQHEQRQDEFSNYMAIQKKNQNSKKIAIDLAELLGESWDREFKGMNPGDEESIKMLKSRQGYEAIIAEVSGLGQDPRARLQIDTMSPITKPDDIELARRRNIAFLGQAYSGGGITIDQYSGAYNQILNDPTGALPKDLTLSPTKPPDIPQTVWDVMPSEDKKDMIASWLNFAVPGQKRDVSVVKSKFRKDKVKAKRVGTKTDKGKKFKVGQTYTGKELGIADEFADTKYIFKGYKSDGSLRLSNAN